VRQSWNPKNLYNLHERSLGGKATEINFKTTSKTVYQQRWLSKQLARGYHGDFLPEGSFQRHYLPASLPALIEKQDTDAMRHRKERTPVPVGSLMFAKLESRLDVLVFRACLAPSVYRARQMVIHRKVTVDGDLVGVLLRRLDRLDMHGTGYESEPAARTRADVHGGPEGHRYASNVLEGPSRTSIQTSDAERQRSRERCGADHA
jgi:ribosomal protein S4